MGMMCEVAESLFCFEKNFRGYLFPVEGRTLGILSIKKYRYDVSQIKLQACFSIEV